MRIRIRFHAVAVVAVVVLAAAWANAASKGFAAYEKGIQYGAQGKFAEAARSFQDALKADPQAVPAVRCLAVLEDLRNRRIKETTAVHLFKAFAAFNNYRANEAIQELNQAAELDPGYAVIYSHRAEAFLDLKDTGKALADFGRAIQADPKLVIAYVNRGTLYARQSRADLAISDFTHALQIEPKNISALYNRGNVYADHERYDQAIADYNRILEIDPKYPHAYVRKGLAYEKSGRPREAAAVYEAYLQNVNIGEQDPRQVAWVREKIAAVSKSK